MTAQAQTRQDVTAIYAALTSQFERPLRVAELVYEAAGRFPGLVPTRAEIDAERALLQKDKAGLEIAQGDLIARVLADPRCGSHLIHSMSQPRPEALAALDQFRHCDSLNLGPIRLDRQGPAGRESDRAWAGHAALAYPARYGIVSTRNKYESSCGSRPEVTGEDHEC